MLNQKNMNQKNSKLRSLFLVLQKVTGISTNYGIEHFIRDIVKRDFDNIWYQVERSYNNCGTKNINEVTKN